VAIGLPLIVHHEFGRLDTKYGLQHAIQIEATALTTVPANCIFFEILEPIVTQMALSKAGEILADDKAKVPEMDLGDTILIVAPAWPKSTASSRDSAPPGHATFGILSSMTVPRTRLVSTRSSQSDSCLNIYATSLLTNRRPVFYAGERLGETQRIGGQRGYRGRDCEMRAEPSRRCEAAIQWLHQ
jgi:hypothetical protein